jgi:hypothetical protein
MPLLLLLILGRVPSKVSRLVSWKSSVGHRCVRRVTFTSSLRLSVLLIMLLLFSCFWPSGSRLNHGNCGDRWRSEGSLSTAETNCFSPRPRRRRPPGPYRWSKKRIPLVPRLCHTSIVVRLLLVVLTKIFFEIKAHQTLLQLKQNTMPLVVSVQMFT